jgi:hypothetical protein
MEVEISSNVKFLKLYPRGREARSWGCIGAFTLVTSQLTAEIILGPRPYRRRSQRLNNADARPQVTHRVCFHLFIYDSLKCKIGKCMALHMLEPYDLFTSR